MKFPRVSNPAPKRTTVAAAAAPPPWARPLLDAIMLNTAHAPPKPAAPAGPPARRRAANLAGVPPELVGSIVGELRELSRTDEFPSGIHPRGAAIVQRYNAGLPAGEW